jgi:RNA polymerase sigma-70 factor (ECF subfamily)
MFHDVTYPDLLEHDVLDIDATDRTSAFVMDEDTFRAFYDRTARGVWVYLARVTGDQQLADDLLQETWYRFLRAAASHDNEIHRRNSLYRIATNLAKDARRRKMVRPFNMEGLDIERVAASGRPDASEKAADVTHAMSRLKPRERAMLWLAYAEGASHREIADVLGLNPASLKLLLFRARRKLATLLGGAK